jgi:hypothetical protein
MTEPKINKSVSKRRPRSKDFISIDTDNAYARLGVSPLESTDKIASLVDDLRGKAMKIAKARTERSIEDEQEIQRLDLISKDIGKPDGRKKYDEEHPQNIMLTLQPSPTEQSWLRHRLDGLISEWLLEELGQDAVLPSFRCLKFWSPQKLDDNLLAFLARFTNAGSPDDTQSESLYSGEEDSGLPILPDDLKHLI